MMKKYFIRGMALTLVLCMFSGCTPKEKPVVPTEPPATATPTMAPTEPPATATPTMAPTEPPATATPTEVPTESPAPPEHSELYIPGVSVEEVIQYFNEVCLDAEMVNSGDPSKLQRWEDPIRYICNGSATDEDKNTLDTFVEWLNTIEGFPGMQEMQQSGYPNMRIHFCDQAEYLTVLGDEYSGTDGGVTFWYNGADEIYDAIIGYRTDIDQEVRNSVILEEIYNGLGPIQDTQLREDSIIYSGYTIPQSLTPVDELLLKLLYHPQMQCGMNAADCEEVIRALYY
jgi:hypothetical protein